MHQPLSAFSAGTENIAINLDGSLLIGLPEWERHNKVCVGSRSGKTFFERGYIGVVRQFIYVNQIHLLCSANRSLFKFEMDPAEKGGVPITFLEKRLLPVRGIG